MTRRRLDGPNYRRKIIIVYLARKGCPPAPAPGFPTEDPSSGVGEVLYRAIGQVLLDMNLAQSVLGLDEVLVRYLPLDLDATNLLALRSGLLRDGLGGRHDFGRLGVRRDVLLFASLQLLLELVAAACSRN